MALPQSNQQISYDDKLNYAINAIQLAQCSSIQAAAALYNVPYTTLHAQIYGHIKMSTAQVNNCK